MMDAVLCELEGVLVDTARPRRAAVRAGLAAVGATPAARDAAVPAGSLHASLAEAVCAGSAADGSAAGRPLAAEVRRALTLWAVGAGGPATPDETAVDLATLAAERHFLEMVGGGLSLADGAREFVERAGGVVRLAIVTRARRREAELMLRLAGLEDAFEFVVAADDVRRAKPAADAHLRALDRLGRRRAVETTRAVALEDGACGIAAARAAGVRCVAVTPPTAGTRVPAAVVMEADAWLPSLAGQTPATLDTLLARGERRTA